jgi:hypothetical protein
VTFLGLEFRFVVRRKAQPEASKPIQPSRIFLAAAVALVAVAVLALVWRATPLNTRADRLSQTSTKHGPTQPARNDADARQAPVAIRLAGKEPHSDTHHAAIDQLAEKANSQRDDWPTEVIAEAASAQLSQFAKWLEQPDLPNHEALQSVVADEFQAQSLLPKDLLEVYRDGLISIRRSDSPTPDTRHPIPAYHGVDGFHTALAELHKALGTDGERHVKFKVYRIDIDPATPNSIRTSLRYEASLHGTGGSRQQTAIWNCQWTYPGRDQATLGKSVPLLTHVVPVRYEEAEVTGLRDSAIAGSLFADCTESALGSNPGYRSQVLPGINHWLRRTPSEFMGKFGHNGLAVGDVNGDGLDDLYVCDSGGLPNRLYVQQPDGTARDVSVEAGVDFLEDSTGALLIDLDNDGDQDLVVAMDPLLQIAENDGTGRFTLHEPLKVNTDSLSLCAADYDADGDLDLYVCGYNVRKQDPTDRGLPFPVPYYDANNGGRNLLLRNEGSFRFVDVTREVGLDENNSRFSMAAAWEDFDNDGDQDLYVANDYGRKNLYQNNGGHFTDIAAAAGVEDTGSGMSVSWDDYNRDGLMDLYVGNMWSSAGNRVTYQARFSTGKSDSTVGQIRRMARGNTLFVNTSGNGRSQFADVSEHQAVEMGRWAWSSKFVDLTNDGWPDLIVANGFVSNPIPDDL